MEPQEEFENLLSGLLDGSSDAERNRRICELLRLHPSLQNDYLELMQLHALLIWREGRVLPASRLNIALAEPSLGGETDRVLSGTATAGRKRSLLGWMKVAAALLLGVSLGMVMVSTFQATREDDGESGPEVVERLVVWNLDIVQAPTQAERREIYESQAANMKGSLNDRRLSGEERKLAEKLVETGAWLTDSIDPMAEAERFGDLADVLLVHLDSASDARDDRKLIRFADTYRRLTEVGVSGNLERAIAIGAPDPKRKPKLDRVIDGDARRAKKLEDLLELHTDHASKALNRALKGHRRKPPAGQKPSN